MTSLAVYAHAAPPTELHLWVAVRAAAEAPKLTFLLDGEEVQALPLRALAPTRQPPCAFTGVYAITDLSADTPYDVRVEADGASAVLRTRTLPGDLAEGSPFRVLLASCYHRDEDPRTLLASLPGRLAPAARPHLVLLVGDQVYLDLPTERNYPMGRPALEAIFEDHYCLNWFGPSGLTTLLSIAPVVCMPDDHEFWNNFPDSAAVVQNSWSSGGRRAWTEAALSMLSAFQMPAGVSPGDPRTLHVGPLSFFFLDTRAARQPRYGCPTAQLVSRASLAALQSWAQRLSASDVGVLVTGQLLTSEPAGDLKGHLGDWDLADYVDYQAIVSAVETGARGAHRFLLLTGDVHWGRVTTTSSKLTGLDLLHEVVSSPSALVTTLGVDSLKRALGWIKGDPWPRHAKPSAPPTYFARAVLGDKYLTNVRHGQEGDHVAMLEFTRRGTQVAIEVTYLPLHPQLTAGSSFTL